MIGPARRWPQQLLNGAKNCQPKAARRGFLLSNSSAIDQRWRFLDALDIYFEGFINV